MDLDEYLFYEKKNNPDFCVKKFAENIGVDYAYFLRILKKKQTPLGIAEKVWELTGGKVDVGKMIVDFFKKKAKEGK